MKKLTALFTIVAMLICMFTFAPAASAAEMYSPDGETNRVFVHAHGPEGSTVVTCWITCNNGWLDGTNGYDYVEAGMYSDIVVTGSASVDATATYIREGSYTSESNSVSASALSPNGISVEIAPYTDLLSYGDAEYDLESDYGSFNTSLSASCPTAVK